MKRFSIMLCVLFVIAFLIRIALINWTLNYGNNGDFSRYEDWARVAHIYGFADAYTTQHLTVWKEFPNNQPPGTLYILYAAYETWIFTGKIIAYITHSVPGSIIWVNTHLQHAIMKLPMLTSDLLTGVVIFLLVAKQAGRKRGLAAASLVLLNPVIFYNSAIWGQTDSLNNFFFILALFFAYRKNIFLSVLAYTASLYIKLSLLPLLPFYLIFLYYHSGKNIKKIALSLAVSAVVILLATIPVSTQPVQWFVMQIPIIARGELQNITVAAFNFWFMLTCLPHSCMIPTVTETFLGIKFSYWAYAAFAFFVLPLLAFQIKLPKKMTELRNTTLLLALVALISFLFLPKMHDRYLYPVIPLLAIAIATRKNWKGYAVIFTLLSLFSLINIIYSWYPIVLDSTTTLYHTLYGPVLRWIVSITTVLVSGWLYFTSIKAWRSEPLKKKDKK